MAKGQVQKHVQARIAFLDQASKYLAEQEFKDVKDEASESASRQDNENPKQGLPMLLTSHLRAVSMKGQARLSQEVKRRICKVCDTPLLESLSSDTAVENHSKAGSKPWADVKVVTCRTCGTKKRFPMNTKRQDKKSMRRAKVVESQATTANTTDKQGTVVATRTGKHHGFIMANPSTPRYAIVTSPSLEYRSEAEVSNPP